MAILKNASRVLKVTYFEIIVCPPTSTLKLKMLMLKLYFFYVIKFKITSLCFL
jgi:hypothetical protein